MIKPDDPAGDAPFLLDTKIRRPARLTLEERRALGRHAVAAVLEQAPLDKPGEKKAHDATIAVMEALEADPPAGKKACVCPPEMIRALRELAAMAVEVAFTALFKTLAR